jgi:subtilisin family serine protease
LGAIIFLLLGLAAAPSRAALPLRSFIVVLNDDVSNPGAIAAQQVSRLGGLTTHVYTDALKGYSALLPTDAIARLAGDHRIAHVELDSVMHIDTTQTGATWGIDRIDQHNRPIDGNYTYNATGAGVKAYIIDTGINFTHNDFGGRAVLGTDKVTGGGGLLGGGGGSTNGVDCNGHGTHVSGTVGGATYGVAKAVTLVAVRVLDCGGSGATSDVIAGIDWVTADHQAGQPAVANMSLGGGANSTLDAAVNRSIADGVAYAVAAGNGNVFGNGVNACNSSPSRVAAAMTIGATDNTDKRATFSNYGNCVDWFAPGVNITSDWMGNNTATNTISGTSMATPHTTGVAALYLQSHTSATPADLRTALYNLTTKAIVTSSNSVNNHLLYTNL